MTDANLRPRRSVLYMPAANERALEKAKDIAADALIFDLEDAVAPDAKAEARERACAMFAGGGYGSREITAIEAALERHGAPDRTRIWAMLETPVAMLHAEEICAASERLSVLVMGTNDLAKELHAQRVPSRQPLMGGLYLSLLAARAADKVILDGVFNDIKDEAGFLAECQVGRQMGFDGKTLIHPSQVGPCNGAFSPEPAEIELAERIIAAFEEAEAEGRGVVTVDGRMIENLHVDEARRVLAIRDAIADASN